MSTAEEVFNRVLGYAGLSQDFTNEFLVKVRYTSFRKIFQLTPAQKDAILKRAEQHEDPAMTVEALDLMKFLATAEHYRKTSNISAKHLIPWETFTEDSMLDAIDDYINSLEGDEEKAAASSVGIRTPSNSPAKLGKVLELDVEDKESSQDTSISYAKVNLKAFHDIKFPTVPVRVNELKTFKIVFKNVLRSMNLEYLLNEDYETPTSSKGYEKFVFNNKFLYSAIVAIFTNPDHEARNVILDKKSLENNGRGAWKKLLDNYSTEVIEGDIIEVTYNKMINLRCNKTHIGAMRTYITKFIEYLQTMRENGSPMDIEAAKAILLSHVDHEAYNECIMNCKFNKCTLTECYDRLGMVATQVEKQHAKAARKLRSAKRGGGGGGNANSNSNSNQGLKFNGHAVNEYGFFRDKTIYDKLTPSKRTKYYKQKDTWRNNGEIKENPRKQSGGGTSEEDLKKSIVKEVYTEVIEAVEASAPAKSSSNNDKDDPNGYKSRILKTLKAKVKVVWTINVSAHVNLSLEESPSNAILDSGADTTLMGSSFVMMGYSPRMANVCGFGGEDMTVGNLKIGTGVAAYDKADGTTLLVIVNEGIDYTTQPNTMLSDAQLRQNGVDVCAVHPKYSTGGRKGLFRIKVGEHELPFNMESCMTALTFRRPTEDELETCDQVIELTSDAQWDPDYITGNNFTSSADHHFYDVSNAKVFQATSTTVGNNEFFDTKEEEDQDNEVFVDATESMTGSGESNTHEVFEEVVSIHSRVPPTHRLFLPLIAPY